MWNEPTKERLNRIPKLYVTEDIPLQDKPIHLHFFIADCDWFVAEHEDGMFWGFVILNGDTVNAEWGYFGLEEMKEKKVNHWLEIVCETEDVWKVRKASEIDKIREARCWLKG